MYRILFFVCLSSSFFAQDNFLKAFGGANNDFGRGVVQTFDKGYAIIGITSSFGGVTDAYLIKTDSVGTMQWQKNIGGFNVDVGNEIIQTPDSGFAFVGHTSSIGNGAYDFYLVKTDKNGNTQWSRAYGGSSWDFGYSLAATSDGGYALVGKTYSFGNGNADIYFVKTDANGDTLFTKFFGKGNEEQANSVVATSDGGYFISGFSKSFSGSTSQFYYLKLDANGNDLWKKNWGGSGENIISQALQTPDGGYAMIGTYSNPLTNGKKGSMLIKLNASGDTLWTRSEVKVNETFTGNSVCLNAKGGYTWVGIADFDPYFGIDVNLHEVDGNGDDFSGTTSVIKGENDTDIPYAVKLTSDSGYIVVGETNSEGAGGYDVFLLKFNKQLQAPAYSLLSVGEQNKVEAVLVYPSPATSIINFSGKDLIGTYSIAIYSVLGELVSVTDNKPTVELSSLPAGLYNFQVFNSTKGTSSFGKFIKE
ncbi:MAG: T9SS type A sorting domain-containing protein [Bacteroidetes bacterium]|nr:T9SS type A sorting domain-containing protein [Bacteroidota bacterium]